MPTHIEDELGLGPTMHRVRRRLKNLMNRVGSTRSYDDERSLDPLTVNYAAWDSVRRSVRTWPSYSEAPNSLEIYVSPEDWEDYWGVDTERKETLIAAYVRSRAAEKGLWMAGGEPTVKICPDETTDIGEVEVLSHFAEVEQGREPVRPPASLSPETTRLPKLTSEHPAALRDEAPRHEAGPRPGAPAAPAAKDSASETVRFVDARHAGKAALVGEGGFRLVIESGDVIGAVEEGVEVDEDVNVRLDAAGFPYVEPRHCAIAVEGGRWTLTNYAGCGTKLVRASGERLMLGQSVPFPLTVGDTVFLGPTRPLRFELL